MPVLPHRSMSRGGRTCGRGTGLRGVTPGAGAWSRGVRPCGESDALTLMQGYIPAGFMSDEGPASVQIFAKIPGYTENSSRSEPHIVVRTWAGLGEAVAPQAAIDDDIGDVPVLLVPIPDGQTSGDMPANDNAGLTTPVIGRFDVDTAHTTEFGASVYLLDATASITEVELQQVCITQKVPLLIDCGGFGGYYEDGMTTPGTLWCFGSTASFSDNVNRFKQIEPDLHHMDYRATQRVSDAEFLPLFPSGSALASGDYLITTATLNQNNPTVGAVPGLGDNPCP